MGRIKPNRAGEAKLFRPKFEVLSKSRGVVYFKLEAEAQGYLYHADVAQAFLPASLALTWGTDRNVCITLTMWLRHCSPFPADLRFALL